MSTVGQLNAVLWHEGVGAYVNKLWTNGTWAPRDPITGVLVLAPTSFYPGRPAEALHPVLALVSTRCTHLVGAGGEY